MKPKNICNHVLFMNKSGIYCIWCDTKVEPMKSKYPRVVWLAWAYWWCFKEKVRLWVTHK